MWWPMMLASTRCKPVWWIAVSMCSMKSTFLPNLVAVSSSRLWVLLTVGPCVATMRILPSVLTASSIIASSIWITGTPSGFIVSLTSLKARFMVEQMNAVHRQRLFRAGIESERRRE